MTSTTSATAVSSFRQPGPTRRALTATFLAAGPAVTCAFVVAHRHSPQLALPGMLSAVLVVFVAVAWCPALMFSLPALVLGAARDVTLPWRVGGLTGLARSVLRGVILVPYMALSPRSPARAETVAALVGWTAGVVVAAPYIHLSALGV